MPVPDSVVTWDWPHRLWHWGFAGAIVVSLATGLSDDLELMELHIASGVAIIGLLLFRVGWALWGGRHVRVTQYRTSPAAVWRHLRGRGVQTTAHTAPGAAMAFAMFFCVLVQAGSGLFASDEIFTDGPFAHYLSDAGVGVATAIHTRLYWIVLGLAVIHVSALAWYALRSDSIALSMLHGRTRAGAAPITQQLWIRATATAIGAAAIVWLADRWL
jgi:cytochrome b